MTLEKSQLNELHWLMEMLHNIDVGLVVLDKEFTVQIFNGFMENHSGLLPREVKGQVIFDLFDEIPRDWFTRKAESVFLLESIVNYGAHNNKQTCKQTPFFLLFF